MNENIFKKEICSYCKHNQLCSKNILEYGIENKIIFQHEYKKNIQYEYTLNNNNNNIKVLKCNNYFKK